MQDMNWNDLRVLLALARAGTLAGAARQLGVDETAASGGWLAAQQPQTPVSVSDHETARVAIAAGLGKSLLACLPDAVAPP
jgi:DNA-binding transcriptional LysR family regulator